MAKRNLLSVLEATGIGGAAGAGVLPLGERGADLAQLVVRTDPLAQPAPATGVPVAGVRQIAFLMVQDGVDPARELVLLVLLHDLVRLLPFAGQRATDGVNQLSFGDHETVLPGRAA